MNNEIIVVKQLPIIEEQLQAIKTQVNEKVKCALSMVCTEDTVKSIKTVRADLNKEYSEFEERRKAVKKAVLSPYEQFEETYKDCIANSYKTADAELKKKIDSVESELKAQKSKEVEDYFTEYLQSRNIDFVTFTMANINVTLSASMKSLKEQAKAYIDRICDDLALIDTQEHKEEILHEYKQKGFNISAAITTVSERHKAIEVAKAREDERKAREQAEQEAAAKVEELAPPAVDPIAPPTVDEPILTVKFAVRGTKTKLKVLKEFLNNGGYDYE